MIRLEKRDSEMRPTEMLRSHLSGTGIIVAPGAYDALTAKIIEDIGFPVVIITGLGVSASFLGRPDAGLLTMTENLLVSGNIFDAVRIPVLADIDTGYGNAVNVIRTIQAFEKAGAAGISIEDQVEPKRCPACVSAAVELVAPEEMAGKIRAAVDARRDPAFVIAARTDAHGAEAVERAQIYAEAGADVIKPTSNAFSDPEGLAQFVRQVQKPVWIMMVRWIEKTLTAVDLETAGVKIVSFPMDALTIAARAVREALEELRRTGTNQSYAARRVPLADFKDFIGMPAVQSLEERYLPKRASVTAAPGKSS